MSERFFEHYQHMPRVRKLTEGLTSQQRSALLETTPLFTNGYTISPYSCSPADLQRLGQPRSNNDLTVAMTKSYRARPFCFSCGKIKISESVEPLKACSHCKTAQYCSVSCQRKDWKLSDGGGQHKAICEDLYQDKMARRVTGEVVKRLVAAGSLDAPESSFASEDAERFNEKIGLWREFGRQMIHLVISAGLQKASKFNIDPVTVLELTSTRLFLEEVPGRQQNENMFHIIYVDQISSDLFVSPPRSRRGSINERIDIFQHLLASCSRADPETTSDEARAPGAGAHAVQFFVAGKPLTYASTLRYDIGKVLGCRMFPFPDPMLTFDKLIGICNRGTMALVTTLPNVVAIRDG